MNKADVQKILDKYEAIEANGKLPVYREVWPCFKAIIELAAINGEAE